MSVADDIQALADLAQNAAHQALTSQIALGTRPSAPGAAALLWDQLTTRLENQIDSLTALATNLSAQAVSAGLSGAGTDLTQLKVVTDRANATIGQINQLSKLFTTIGHILDVGMAVLAVAATPSPGTVSVLVQKIQTLAADV